VGLGFFEGRSSGGLDQNLGEFGHTLSGGQKQRVGLARALHSEPELIVLDEATSALDSETEALITRAINFLQGSVTLIIIAHRLSTIREFKQIALLEESALTAIGNFNDLKNSSASFRRQTGL